MTKAKMYPVPFQKFNAIQIKKMLYSFFRRFIWGRESKQAGGGSEGERGFPAEHRPPLTQGWIPGLRPWPEPKPGVGGSTDWTTQVPHFVQILKGKKNPLTFIVCDLAWRTKGSKLLIHKCHTWHITRHHRHQEHPTNCTSLSMGDPRWCFQQFPGKGKVNHVVSTLQN